MRGSPLAMLCVLVVLASCSGTHGPPNTASPARALVDARADSIQVFLADRHTGLSPAQIEAVAQAIVLESDRAGITPGLVTALIHVESSGRNYARSRVGALGLMQLLPDTGAAVARRAGVPWQGPETLFDPVSNVRLGVTYLAELIERFGDVELALAAYNWGPTRIAGFMSGGQRVPMGYATRVLSYYRSDAFGLGVS